MDKIERIKRELVYKGAIIDVYKDYVKIPNGNTAEWDFIMHKGAAAVIPVTENGNILMVRQYRNALDRETLEIPAGGINPGEEMIVSASRELEEETGFRSDNLTFLISIRTTVAFCNERIDIFVAHNLIKTRQNLDEDEFVDVEEYSPVELVNMINNGAIQDSKTVSAIMTYYNKYCHE